MVFKDKGNAEELLEKLEESQKKLQESKRKAEESAKKIETLEKELERDARGKPGADAKPEIGELLEHMTHIPVLYYEILGYFQRFKVENRELVDTSMQEGEKRGGV